MIEEILSKPRNNPVFSFDRSSELENWLRDQWAGLFRDMLRKKSEQHQLSNLSVQINDLKSLNETLKTYMEAVLQGKTSDESVKIIRDQDKKLEDSRIVSALSEDGFYNFLVRSFDFSNENARNIVLESKSFDDVADKVISLSKDKKKGEELVDLLRHVEEARKDFNKTRMVVGKDPLPIAMSEARPSRNKPKD